MANLSQLTDRTFTDFVHNSTPTLVDFSASWCGPCRRLNPVLDEFAAMHKEAILVGKVDVDEHPDIAAKYGVMSVPTMILFESGQPLQQLVGFRSLGQLEDELVLQR